MEALEIDSQGNRAVGCGCKPDTRWCGGRTEH
jgi:hypothetical protein